mgnify:CR=1 FL=1
MAAHLCQGIPGGLHERGVEGAADRDRHRLEGAPGGGQALRLLQCVLVAGYDAALGEQEVGQLAHAVGHLAAHLRQWGGQGGVLPGRDQDEEVLGEGGSCIQKLGPPLQGLLGEVFNGKRRCPMC